MEVVIKKLEDVASIQYGFPFNSKLFAETGPIRVLRIRDIKGKSDPTYYTGDYNRDYEVGNGDLLVGMDGEFNCTIWSAGRALLNQRMAKITPKSSVDKTYVFYLLKTKLKLLEEQITGSTVKHLLDPQLRGIEMPLLPLERQRRVGSILERADRLRGKREQATQLFGKIIQSLFLKMFGDPANNTRHWETATIDSTCSDITDCPHSTPTYTRTGVPLVRTPNIKKGYIDLTETKFISTKEHIVRSRRINPLPGDILYAREATFGNAGLVKKGQELSVGQRIMLLRPNPSIVLSEFLVWMINSEYVYSQAATVARGATNPHVNVADAKKFRIIVPPIENQMRFASAAKVFESLRERQAQSTEEINELFNSLMNKAFRAQMVS
jgi:type I restriction enzyme S subunit